MKRLIALVLCWPVWVGAADHYIDCSAGSNGDGTEGSPLNTISGLSLSASDNVYFKAGVTCGASKADTSAAMLLIDAANVNVDVFGGSDRALLDGEASIPYGFKILGVSGTTINNVDVTRPSWNAMRAVNAQGGTTDITATLNNVQGSYCGPGDDTDAGSGASAGGTALWKGTCFIAGTEGVSNYATYTITYNNVDSLYAARIGFDCRGKCTITADSASSSGYSGCYDSGEATVSGGHGFSGHPTFTRVTSGWTLVSGTIYKRNVISIFDDLQVAVNESVSPTTKAYFVATADGAPSWNATELHGEMQKVDNGTAGCANANGCIYVNFGRDITSETIRIIRQPHSATYNGVKAYGTCDITGIEGHGIVADDYTNAFINRAESYSNAGNGVQLLGGTDGSVISSVIYNNDGQGINVSGADGVVVQQNSAGVNAGEQINYAGRFRTGEAKNNLTIGGTYGIRYQHNATTLVTSASNHAFGASTSNCDGPTCTETNPLLAGGSSPTTAAGFKLSSGSPLRAAGTYVGSLQDHGNRRFKFPPSIGAWEAAAGDAAESRTARGQ